MCLEILCTFVAMSHSIISRDQIKQFSPFSKAFRKQDAFSEFLTKPFNSFSDILDQSKVKQIYYSKQTREVLVQTWMKQIESYASESQKTNLKNLSLESTFTITTGHQLTLFGGPMYLIYKVLHVVKLAEEFNSVQTDYKAVPVFWMASEDHDFDEVKSTHLFNQKISWESNQSGPVGRFNMADFAEVHKVFADFFKDKETEIKDLLSISIKQNYAAYLQEFLSKLFADFGVLVLNPDVRELKRLFAPVVLRELESPAAYNAVLEVNQQIEKAGFQPQAQARSCNLFYLKPGKRLRIEPVDEAYSIDGEIYSKEQLVSLVASEPESFSPNVILRPVYQETILPNLIYVGGGGEMAYWIQLKRVFAIHETIFPLILQRVSIQLNDSTMEKRLNKLNWSIDHFFSSKEDLKKEFLKENSESDLDFTELNESFETLRNSMIQKAKSIDVAMESFAEAEAVRIRKQLESFEQRLLKQLKQRHEQSLQAIEFVSDRVIPENSLQERHFHWLQFAPSGAYKQLLQQIYAEFSAFESDLIVISV